jgi:hypothetical protein
LVYRQFATWPMKIAFPAVGHYYLAFDDRDLPDPGKWRRLVATRGGQGDRIGNTPTPPRPAFPDGETFSFHPRKMNEADEVTGDKIGVLHTEGKWIGYNDPGDQERFVRGRAALAGESFHNPYDRQIVWKIPATQEQQQQLYLQALAERQLINAGRSDFGSYCLGKTNCGTWARFMIERAGLPVPREAEMGNIFGVGIGGPSAKPAGGATDELIQTYEGAQSFWPSLENQIRSLYRIPKRIGAP